MVLAYYHKPKAISWLRQTTKASEQSGTSLRAMADTLRGLGFVVRTKQNASLKDIKQYLEAKTPIIVNYRDCQHNEGHFALVVGWEKNFLIVQDPLLRPNSKISQTNFLQNWHGQQPSRSRRWLMAARPK